jgi:hypothetical protein
LAVAILLVGLLLLPGSAAFGRSIPLNSDNDPATRPEVIIPEPYRVAASDSIEAVSASNATIWFTPEDTNDTTTLIFLYNPTASEATVSMVGYSKTGAQTISASIQVPANNLVRITSDAISSADLPPSWASAIFWNFTDSAVYAKLVLPTTVHIQSYVAWAGNSGSYDPNNTGPKVPLRLSSDPATVFLPAVMR